ncbi:MAG: hypothetical protein Q4F65_10700, partial [Propionibacteriaceae bacterium]|nr:hypothetical protein [Propionibacteriaceae bacterium]
TSQLKAEGWSDHQIAHAVDEGQLVRVARSMFRWSGDLDDRDAHVVRVHALVRRLRCEVVVSHASAAVLHGLSVAEDNPAEVSLTVAPPARVRRRAGYHLRVAKLAEDDVEVLDGVHVTSLARTAADLARTAPFAWAVVAADQALARGVRREELDALAEAHPRMAGTPALRSVAAFADGASGSVAESISRVTIRRAGLPAPELQREVIGPEGWVGTTDFAWEDYGVIGEMDGEAKYRDRLERLRQAPEKVFAAERVRDDLIRRAGWWPCHWGWKLAWDVVGLGAKLREEFDHAASFRKRSA